LKISDYDLNITFCNLKNDLRYNCVGMFRGPNVIWIDQFLNEKETIITLFHEIRHYYQYLTKMFDFCKYSYDISWEMDAIKFSINTYLEYKKEISLK
jgi:hypothetical protein